MIKNILIGHRFLSLRPTVLEEQSAAFNFKVLLYGDLRGVTNNGRTCLYCYESLTGHAFLEVHIEVSFLRCFSLDVRISLVLSLQSGK